MPCGRVLDRRRLGEADDTGLRGRIDAREWRGVEAGERRPVDDGAAVARLEHDPDPLLDAVEHTAQVDLDQLVVMLGGDVGEHRRIGDAGDVAAPR